MLVALLFFSFLFFSPGLFPEEPEFRGNLFQIRSILLAPPQSVSRLSALSSAKLFFLFASVFHQSQNLAFFDFRFPNNAPHFPPPFEMRKITQRADSLPAPQDLSPPPPPLSATETPSADRTTACQIPPAAKHFSTVIASFSPFFFLFLSRFQTGHFPKFQ